MIYLNIFENFVKVIWSTDKAVYLASSNVSIASSLR